MTLNTSKNEYIIGDCEEKLKVIKENTVKMIYIDPPYNTLNKSFEYNDNREKWYDFMHSKIRKAYSKLVAEGVMFISIDDNEYVNLRIICDDIFGKDNCLGNFITRQATRSNAKHINTIHEYVVVYAKDKLKVAPFKLKRINIPVYKEVINQMSQDVSRCFEEKGIQEAETLLKSIIKDYKHREEFTWLKNYNLVDSKGQICFAKDLSTPGKPNDIFLKKMGITLTKLRTRAWSSEEKITNLYDRDMLIWKNDRPYEKGLLTESSDNAMSILNFYSRMGKHDLDRLGLKNVFTTPKPVEMIKFFISLCVSDNDIVLDFFAGSGTTAQAVIEYNEENDANLIFKIIQRKELIESLASKNILEKKGYEACISNVPILRLNELKKRYNFEYEILN